MSVALALGRRRAGAGVPTGTLAMGTSMLWLSIIVLLQRLTLYLGQPAFALSLCLAALLIGAAIGSSLTARLRGNPDQAAATCAIAVPVLLVLLTWMASLTLACVAGSAASVRVEPCPTLCWASFASSSIAPRALPSAAAAIERAK